MTRALRDEIAVLTAHVQRLEERIQWRGTDRLREEMDAERERRRRARREGAPEPTVDPATIRAIVERSRAAEGDSRTSGEQALTTIVGAMEDFLAALSDRDGDPLDRHARTTEAVARLGELGVRLPQVMVDRIECQRAEAS